MDTHMVIAKLLIYFNNNNEQAITYN